VVIVNDLLARQLFPGENPVGKMIIVPLKAQNLAFEIVGVVRASRYYDLHSPPLPGYFYSLPQWGPYMPTLHVRVESANSGTVVAEVRREFDAIDRGVPVFDIRTLQDRANDTLAQQRMVTDLAGAFGALALTLVAVGLYGLMAFSVARRTREIGIRVALGAVPIQIVRLIARQGMSIVVFGLALGLPASILLTHQMAGMLYDVEPGDPTTFLVVSLLLAGVTFVASYIPTRRAAKVDPMVALRYE